MKIDEVIKREEETAEYYENIIKTRSLKDIGSIDEFYENDQVAIDVFLTVCKMCIEQSRQTAEWLEDYKRLLGATESIRAEIEELPIDYVNVYDGPNRLGETEFIGRDEVLEILGKYEEVQQ